MRYNLLTWLFVMIWLGLITVVAHTSDRQPEGEPMTLASFDQSACKHVINGCRAKLNGKEDLNLVATERACANAIETICLGFHEI